MANQFVTNPDSALYPKKVVIAQELSADFLITAGSGYSLRVDPASDVVNTHSAAGVLLKLAPGAAPKSTATTFAYDAVSKILSIAVDGQATPLTVNLSALDDEGTKLVINGQNLELQNAAGLVLSSTSIGQLDAQQLTGLAGPTGYKFTLSNGGSVTLTCADIGQMYASGASTTATELLSKECKAVKVSELPIAPGQLTAGALPTTVTVSGSSINSPITNPSATIPGANVVGPLSPSVLPPTTNTLAISGTNLTSTVDGIAATVALTSIVTCNAVKAAFSTVAAPDVGMHVLNDACGKLKLVQDVSSTGILLDTWSIVAP